MINWYRMLAGDVYWFGALYSNDPYVSESCGAELTWDFDFDTGVMIISGNGKMAAWEQPEDVPWHYIRQFIKNVIIEDGAVDIGSYAFADCDLRRLTAAASVTAMGEDAFRNCWADSVHYGGRARTWYSFCRDSGWIGRLSCVDSVENGREGLCGEDAFYVHDLDTGVLTITGTGAITEEPWWWDSDQVKTVIIGSGITEIAEYMFSNYANLSRATIPYSVTRIGEGSFVDCAEGLVICGALNSAAANYAIWHLIDFEPFAEGQASYDNYAIDMERSSLYSTVASSTTVSSNIPVTLNYAIRADRYPSVFDKKLIIRFSDNLELAEEGILLDGKLTQRYEYDESAHILTIPVTASFGTLRFTLTPVESGKVAVSALFSYVYNAQELTDAIGLLYLDAPLLKHRLVRESEMRCFSYH